ncbi:MAG: ABC transporter ATP-binding protein [Pseudobdellovibrionaceae bacterium]
MLVVENLKKTFKTPRAFKKPLEVQALRGVSLSVDAGETLAIVGESGCGKSTLAKVLLKIESPSSGQVTIDGKALAAISLKELSDHMQMIFQDPYSSINPRKKVFQIISEPLKIKGVSTEEIKKSVESVAQMVGLRPEILRRYPHMLSGGQRQRVGIARALVTSPQLIVCDEPVSALDVSVQAQVLNLLLDLQKQKGLSYLFISHDLGVVRFLAHRVGVMYLGQIVEIGDRDAIFKKPLHPYTQLLLKSTPSISIAENFNTTEATELPSPLNPPSGCSFHTRCPYMTELCREKTPELRVLMGSQVACHHAEKIAGGQA